MDKEFKTIESGPEFVGKNLRVQKELVSDGSRNFFVDVVNFPNSTAILPITERGTLILERHYRHPIKETILEAPAGKLEPGEEPEDGARRELLEETGYKANSVQSLGIIFAAPGYSTERAHLFAARLDEKPEQGQSLEPGEKIALQEFAAGEIQDLILKGDLRDSMTISLIFAAKLRGLI